VQHPNMMVGDVDYLSEFDQTQIYEWNREWPEMTTSCAHELFHQRVKAQPRAQAIRAFDGNFTYQELDQLSTRVAYYLVRHGVVPEAIVPLCFEKSAWAIITMLGVMKIGGAFVFLDASNPLPRIKEILSQVNSSFVVASPASSSTWPLLNVDVHVITPESVLAMPAHSDVPLPQASSSNAMYVVFTSGSTGRPKGCVIEHGSFCSGATRHAQFAGLGPGSYISQFASYTFDVSILEIATAISAGACVCVPGEEALQRGLATAINEFGITWAFLTPSMVRLIKPSDVPALKTLVLGGEALSKQEVDTWADKLQLINGYGPSECSIAATASVVDSEMEPSNIGRAVGGVTWIVEPDDHNRLVPVGSVGELLIQGPILARCYLNNPEKTSEVFINSPAWLKKNPSGQTDRFYKTGDLVRYNPDGSIRFVGRKDTQVKLRGQRLEIGEIEHHLVVDSSVDHAMVVLPKTGFCAQRLAAVLSLEAFKSAKLDAGDEICPIDDPSTTEPLVHMVRQRLSSRLPSYMVPTVWIVVRSIPLMSSGKLNRVKISQWIANIPEDTYLKLIGVETSVEAPTSPSASEQEMLLQRIYSDVLNLRLDQVSLERSFLSLGGDSISAMQVMGRCRDAGLSIALKDILRCRSITEVVSCVCKIEESLFVPPERFNVPFELSPVQQMYFATNTEEGSSNHYNQSFFLQLTEPISEQILQVSIEALIERHSMLRARFNEAADGKWFQCIPQETTGSYTLSHHKVSSLQKALAIIKTSHKSIDYRRGPTFIADSLTVSESGEQYLFMVAHHLVVDLVSWRIILQNLEKLLQGETLPPVKPLAFQSWVDMQAQHAKEKLNPQSALPFEIPSPAHDYWGMVGRSNLTRDTLEEIVSLDVEETDFILGSRCHTALSTEPIDLLTGALVHSFGEVFKDRVAPPLFREGHGREPWSDNIDVSGTVGWFTTMYPLHPAGYNATENDVVDIVRRLKDVSRGIPANGWQYFVSRFLNEQGKRAFGDHTNVEITFDYLGRFQQLERSDSLFKLVPRELYSQRNDVGDDVCRFMLIEVTAEVIHGRLQYQFLYNRHMKHQEKIRLFIRQCRDSLKLATEVLSKKTKESTLSDFPGLPLTYANLKELTANILPNYGIELANVEDIYPCTPMQRGLLISQLKHAGSYEYSHTMEVTTSSLEPVDPERLKQAWSQVVAQHAALRTIFFESTDPDRLYDQVVIKNIDPWIESRDIFSGDLQRFFAKQAPVTAFMKCVPHRLTLCTTESNRNYCKLELNHAIVDGASLPIILQDLQAAYDGNLPVRPSQQFGEYVSYVNALEHGSSLGYWQEYLGNLDRCYVNIEQPPAIEKRFETVKLDLDIDHRSLQALCENSGFTVSNVVQTAWGLVLRSYTGLDRVSFGYLSSGRDGAVGDMQRSVGPYLAMLICKLDLTGPTSLIQLIETACDEITASLPHQYCSLAEIQHALGLSGASLFNTVVSLQKHVDTTVSQDQALIIHLLEEHDPTEVRGSTLRK
jgi:amino acid adenylation domain-containing protein/non-ribosomal peptide synthase protein (TIGR01720 family)